ncbi:hypothetical protein JYB62_14425 [Algoriphagus lutimaris]|uniref:hypothetical protein n=1 Tax=Algoriphagus lutimaris TaxID=613197 RepID=UPI00196AA90F|nr:hypothetical protein [Algoriphagus lutimaris]MBN3521203.1 hypothetical protein [Algoriphagus lutimaris]
MLTTILLAFQFLIGIIKRLIKDRYYRSIGLLNLLVLLVGTLYTWLAGGWPLKESILYSVTTMSMNTPYSGPLIEASGDEMLFFHLFYTFLSVGIFIIFTMETGKTIHITYEEAVKKMAQRRAKKNAGK